MVKKYVGWGIVHQLYGQNGITIVPAEAKDEAIPQIEAFLQLQVQDKTAVRRVCVVLYPGPLDVKKMPEQDWDKAFAVIKDKDNGR